MGQKVGLLGPAGPESALRLVQGSRGLGLPWPKGQEAWVSGGTSFARAGVYIYPVGRELLGGAIYAPSYKDYLKNREKSEDQKRIED